MKSNAAGPCDEPLISCIVPVFNGERYIAEALDSILAQSYRPIEIVVADDGSTDGTHDLVATYGELVRFESQPTSGPAATRNFGLRQAKGEFVAFLDPDDLWHPEKLALQMTRFENRKDLDVCVTHAELLWSEELQREAEYYKNHPRGRVVPGYATTTLLARKTLMEQIGPFCTDLWLSDATEWFLRAREQGITIELMPQALTYHRMHTTNLTRRKPDDVCRDEWLGLIKNVLDRRRQTALAKTPGAESSRVVDAHWQSPAQASATPGENR